VVTLMAKIETQFGKRLKELRKQHSISAEELAKLMGINKSTISRYETGKREPYIPFVQELASYFNVSMDWLVGRSEIKTSNISLGILEKIFKSLPEDGKVELINYAKYLQNNHTDTSKTNSGGDVATTDLEE